MKIRDIPFPTSGGDYRVVAGRLLREDATTRPPDEEIPAPPVIGGPPKLSPDPGVPDLGQPPRLNPDPGGTRSDPTTTAARGRRNRED